MSRTRTRRVALIGTSDSPKELIWRTSDAARHFNQDSL